MNAALRFQHASPILVIVAVGAAAFSMVSCTSQPTLAEFKQQNADLLKRLADGFAAAQATVREAAPGTPNGCLGAPTLTLSGQRKVGNTEIVGWHDLVARGLHKDLENTDGMEATLRTFPGAAGLVWRWTKPDQPDAKELDSKPINENTIKFYQDAKKVDHVIVYKTRKHKDDNSDIDHVDIHLLEFPSGKLVCSTVINSGPVTGVTPTDFVTVGGPGRGSVRSSGNVHREGLRLVRKAFATKLKEAFSLAVKVQY